VKNTPGPVFPPAPKIFPRPIYSFIVLAQVFFFSNVMKRKCINFSGEVFPPGGGIQAPAYLPMNPGLILHKYVFLAIILLATGMG
jgi:hypothetical protein